MNDLDDPGSRAFSVGQGDWPLRGFVVRVGNDVFAYVNRCPHAGHPLNWHPDEFLSIDRTLIMCRSHGAMFERDNGRCVAGPCAGKFLQSLPVKVEDGVVILQMQAHELANFV